MKISLIGLWFGALVWFILSCYGLFLRTSGAAPNISHLDKAAHFVMFFGQFYLIGILFNMSGKAAIKLWGLALVWAALSELIQGYATTRTMDVYDGVADMMGATLAIALLYFIKQKKPNFRPNHPHAR